jgi:uncharacterized protein YjiS (DUF1127 family)
MTHLTLVLNSYLQSPIELVAKAFSKLFNAIAESRMRSAMNYVRAEMMRNRRYRETFNELSKLSDKELYDIGLHRGMIHSVSMEAILDDHK